MDHRVPPCTVSATALADALDASAVALVSAEDGQENPTAFGRALALWLAVEETARFGVLRAPKWIRRRLLRRAVTVIQWLLGGGFRQAPCDLAAMNHQAAEMLRRAECPRDLGKPVA